MRPVLFLKFLSALWRHHAQLLTGALMTIIGLGWQAAQWQNPQLALPKFEPWFIWVPGLLILFVSTFLAWTDEHKRAEALRSDLNGVHTPQPRIIAKYDGILFGDTSTQPLTVDLENLGDAHALSVQIRSLEVDGQIVEFAGARLVHAGATVSVTTGVIDVDKSRPLAPPHNTLGGVIASKRGEMVRTQKTWPLVVDYTDVRGSKYESRHMIQMDLDTWTAAIIPAELGVRV